MDATTLTNGFALSLQPFYTPPDLEVDQGLVGSWTTQEGDLTFSFEQGEGKEYKIVVKETGGGRESSAQFEGHLVRLGAPSFVDFSRTTLQEEMSFTGCICCGPTRSRA